MKGVLWGLGLLLILLPAATSGLRLQRLLRERHRAQGTTDAIRTIAGMIVTFAALVLGLLVTSTKGDFDEHTRIYRRYGISLIQLDLRLREYGPSVDTIRRELRAYTATVIAVTWPDQPLPARPITTDLEPKAAGGDETPALTRLMTEMDDAIERLTPADPYRQKIAAILQDDIRQVAADRWTLVERAHSRLDPTFFVVIMLWLSGVFMIFGVTSPPNALTMFCDHSVGPGSRVFAIPGDRLRRLVGRLYRNAQRAATRRVVAHGKRDRIVKNEALTKR